MRRHTGPAAAAAVVLTAFLSTAALAAVEPSDTDSSSSNIDRFDLGVDVSAVPATPAGVRSFLATLPADGASAVVAGCEHLMLNPESARSQDALTFCSVLVGS
jgi:hypothetical protein